MKAIVLDADTKSALVAIRTLGRQGIEVIVAASRASAMGLHSQYAKEWLVYRSPVTDPEQFLEDLLAVARDEDEPPVVYCFSDATYLAIARKRSEVEAHCTLLLPPAESVETAFSKARTYDLARSLSIPTIKELSAETVTEFPVVVKPVHTVSWRTTGHQGTAEFAFTPAELSEKIAHLKTLTRETPVLQEFVKGKEYGVELLCQAGEVVQAFAHERIRSLSPRGGAATVKRVASASVAVEEMRKHAFALAKALKWEGPMMVEFKVDERTNTPVLMEINGRFWGSLPLAQSAGVDFVGGFYALATGAALPTAALPRSLQTQHFLGDTKWLLQVFFNNDPLRDTLYPSRLSALRDWFFSTIFDEGDVWSFHDPKPFFMEYHDVIKRML